MTAQMKTHSDCPSVHIASERVSKRINIISSITKLADSGGSEFMRQRKKHAVKSAATAIIKNMTSCAVVWAISAQYTAAIMRVTPKIIWLFILTAEKAVKIKAAAVNRVRKNCAFVPAGSRDEKIITAAENIIKNILRLPITAVIAPGCLSVTAQPSRHSNV